MQRYQRGLAVFGRSAPAEGATEVHPTQVTAACPVLSLIAGVCHQVGVTTQHSDAPPVRRSWIPLQIGSDAAGFV